MPTATAPGQAAGATLTFQGQTVPAESVNAAAFFAQTRRKRASEYSRAYAGLGNTDTVELRKSDIISVLHVRFSGSVVVVHGTGTCAATFRWPYDLVKAFRFTANGQSNLINASGAKLKLREMAGNPEACDRGVVQSVSGANVQQGTLSQASESWGVGPGQSGIASGTYPVELYWKVPVSEDEKDLSGAIFAQTSAMDLNLFIDWNTAANLFVITGNDTVAVNGNVVVETEKFSIPVVGGNFVIPDLSLFHSLVQTTVGTGISQGDNELRVIGQGAGKQLIRLFYQVWNGNAPQVPLAATAANFGPQGWRYGTNETPELFPDGRSLREWNEQLYGSDVGSVWGFLVHEFEATWGFRDCVDMGQTSELRLYINMAAALTTPNVEYVQETMFAAGSAA
jgi:hypothetical protein